MANALETMLEKLKQSENPADFPPVLSELEQALPDDLAVQTEADRKSVV